MTNGRLHSQRLKEDIWLMRLFNFCPSYTPELIAALLVPQLISRSL